MTSLEQAMADMPAALANQQKGADEERAKIVAFLRQEASVSKGADAELLNDYADMIEAGDHDSDG